MVPFRFGHLTHPNVVGLAKSHALSGSGNFSDDAEEDDAVLQVRQDVCQAVHVVRTWCSNSMEREKWGFLMVQCR